MAHTLRSLDARKKLTDGVITGSGRIVHGELRGSGNECELGSGSHGGVLLCGFGPALIELAGVKQNWQPKRGEVLRSIERLEDSGALEF